MQVRNLTVHTPDAEDSPYYVPSDTDLRSAIRCEAEIVAGMLDSRHLATGNDDERDRAAERIRAAAFAALRGSGRYRDPLGVLWTLTTTDAEVTA